MRNSSPEPATEAEPQSNLETSFLPSAMEARLRAHAPLQPGRHAPPDFGQPAAQQEPPEHPPGRDAGLHPSGATASLLAPALGSWGAHRLVHALLLSLGRAGRAPVPRQPGAPNTRVWRDALTSWCKLAHCTLRRPSASTTCRSTAPPCCAPTPKAAPLPLRPWWCATGQRGRGLAQRGPDLDRHRPGTRGGPTQLLAGRCPVARRWRAPTRLGSDTPVPCPPQRSTTLVWHLRAPTLQPAGYTAELFTPIPLPETHHVRPDLRLPGL